MKQVLLFLLVFCAFGVRGQVITTFAGNGMGSYLGENGLATNASLPNPNGGIFDNTGNFYFSLCIAGNRVCKIDTNNIITTLVGNGGGGYSGDNGPAILALVKCPYNVKLDKNKNVYINDFQNARIRKINCIDGIISTIAGTGSLGYSGDGGQATNAMIWANGEICFDKYNNLYIADYGNARVRKIDTLGVITTIAGNGTIGFSGDGMQATNAQVIPSGLAVDNNNNIYIADPIYNRVRKVNTAGIISTIAGNGSLVYTSDGVPATNCSISPFVLGMNINENKLYIGDKYNRRVYSIDYNGILHHIAGNGLTGYNGDGEIATSASIDFPTGISVDKCGNLHIAEGDNFRIRKVLINPVCLNLQAEELKSNLDAIHPNPTTSTLQIDNLKTITQYHLYNMLGATIMQGILKPGNNTLPLDALQPGIYMLALIEEEGEKTVHKVVKE